MTESEQMPVSEHVSRQKIFEKLFPGNRWESMIQVHPLNVVPLVQDLLLNGDLRDGDFGRAVESHSGYAHRIDLPRPDQLTLSYLLMGTIPTDQQPNRGWVYDLLDEEAGEKLGGMALRHIEWMNKQSREQGAKLIAEAAIHQDISMYDQSIAYVIGVLNRFGKPAGIITFRKGDRPRKGKREMMTEFVGFARTPEPISIPVRSK